MLQQRTRKMILAGALALATWALTSSQAVGWGQGGHRVVANIAYDRLTPEERTAIVKVLSRHEDFKARFEAPMPKEVSAGPVEDRERWIFLQAAIWPDLIRPIPRFHRETWHYVNMPYFLSAVDEKALAATIKPNVSADLPFPLTNRAKEDLNCIQAFKLCVRELSDSHTTDQERALYYCWLLHIAGDVHQPLHSTSLVSRARFNQPEGDRGGGRIRIVQDTKGLHHYWDNLYGSKQSLKRITDRTRDILDRPGVKKAAEAAARNLDVKAWVQESHDLAKTVVYTKDILDTVTAGEIDPDQPLPKVNLSEADQKKARDTVDRRVAEAGYRLAEILKRLE
jgi:hypothetical protein